MTEPDVLPMTSYELYFRSLITKKLGKSHSHAIDDIWQELLIAIANTKNEPKTIDKPKAWISKIINNKVADYFRKHEQTKRLEDSIYEKMETPNSSTPFDWVLEMDDLQQVRTALTQCSQTTQEILKLKYFSNASVNQIASKLEISIKAAEYRLHKARQEFKTQFKQS